MKLRASLRGRSLLAWRLAVRYVLAIVLPPIAVLSCGKWFQAVMNLVLTLCFWLPGAIHAMFVVSDYHRERELGRMVRALGVR